MMATLCQLMKLQKRSLSSSANWIQRQRKDIYVKQSKVDGYRCRSAYKLLELNQRYKLLRPGNNVVDLGACPGSWSQVVCEHVYGKKQLAASGTLIKGSQTPNVVVAVDLNEIKPMPGVLSLTGDFKMPTTQQKVQQLLPTRKASVILSDMAPNASGDRYTDHVRIIELTEAVVRFCEGTLAQRGHMVCKVWDGPLLNDLLRQVRELFSSVRLVKPPSSRKESSEIYIVSLGFK